VTDGSIFMHKTEKKWEREVFSLRQFFPLSQRR